MDTAIQIALQSIAAIDKAITTLRQTPEVVQSISEECSQLGQLLGALRCEFEMCLLSAGDMVSWLAQQMMCNRILHQIKVILEDYERGSSSRVSIVCAVQFEMGPKQKLLRLIKTLRQHTARFHQFSSEQVRSPIPLYMRV